MSRSGLVDQRCKEGSDHLGNVGLFPVVANSALALVDLQVVAELVSPAPLTSVGTRGRPGGQKGGDQALLVRGQVVRIEAGDHGQTCEATTADELEVHDPNVAAVTPRAHGPEPRKGARLTAEGP